MTEQTFINRYDDGGHWRLISYAEGYCTVRRKGAGACIMPIGKWLRMSVKPIEPTPVGELTAHEGHATITVHRVGGSKEERKVKVIEAGKGEE